MPNSLVHPAISIRIVLAFLEFLSYVQSSVGDENKDRIEKLKKSLIDIFNMDPSMIKETISNVPSRNLFNLASKKEGEHNAEASDMPRSLSNYTGSAIEMLPALFHEFHIAVAAVGFYNPSIGEDYLHRKSHVENIFKEAIGAMISDGYQTYDKWNLADILKTLGNDAMRSLCYRKAIEMHSCAIALWRDNPIFFCNRAEAFTKVGRFQEAIFDCHEAIKLEPRYEDAYYHLGCAFFEQGRYFEAIREGFMKALQLDPNNGAALYHIQRAENKMREQVSWVGEQVYRITSKGFVPVISSNSPTARLTTVGVFEGGNGPWEEQGEDMSCIPAANGDGDDGDTLSVADNFIDMQVRDSPSPK